MVGHQELRILQYNVQKSRDVVLADLFRDSRILEYDLLAIQEPWRNPFVATSYNPLKMHFHLMYREDEETRACFYINKRIDRETWTVSHVTKDLTTLTITSPTLHHKLHIINVYNEIATSTLQDLDKIIEELDRGDEFLILGDFNLHHPMWSTRHRHANTGITAAQPLLAIVEKYNLKLMTALGTSTHRWKTGESTIDLTFASEELASRTIKCKIDNRLDCDSDHLLIAVVIERDWQNAPPERKRMWAKTDIPLLQETVSDRLPEVADDTELSDKKCIDEYVQSIVAAVNAGIETSTPYDSPFSHLRTVLTSRILRAFSILKPSSALLSHSGKSREQCAEQRRTRHQAPTGSQTWYYTS